MSNEKAPGFNAFNALFFKVTWDISCQDICEVIKSFFSPSFLLEELNCITIALVPECDNPSPCKNFRPVSCYNVLYKCITKILANRLKGNFLILLASSSGIY